MNPWSPVSCPWCNVATSPSAAAQTCVACKRQFTLSAGPALDANVIAPPPDLRAMKISIRWSAVVTYNFATLDVGGVTSGMLDPVIAVAPIDQVGIAFPDVVSIAVWRKIGWSNLIVGILVPLPIGLLMTVLGASIVLKAPGAGAIVGLIGLAFLGLAALMIRRGVIVGRRQARVVGRAGQRFVVQFDKSPAFYDQLFRRCGLTPPPIP